MVDKVRKLSTTTVRKIENAYAIFAMAATAAAATKCASLPKPHTSIGQLPVWQVVAGIVFAGLFYELYRLLEGKQ